MSTTEDDAKALREYQSLRAQNVFAAADYLLANAGAIGRAASAEPSDDAKSERIRTALLDPKLTDQEQEQHISDLAAYRAYRRMQGENPFHAAQYRLANGGAIERGANLDTPTDSGPEAA
jgi:hypothetical protein